MKNAHTQSKSNPLIKRKPQWEWEWS